MRLIFALAMALLLLPQSAFAQLPFPLLGHKQLQNLSNKPALIRGDVVDRSDYPGIIWIGNCTATLIGPRTVLTAAHCTRSSANFTYGTQRYTSRCVSSRYYPRNSTADYSICHVDRDVTGVSAFDTIATDFDEVKNGDMIIQTGFGCTRWGTRLDGRLRAGLAQILRMPSGSNNDYVTGNGTTLCSGDSGGPAYSVRSDGSRGKVISTNSRSNTTTRSYLSSWVTSQGKEVVAAYMNRYPQAKVCGLTAGLTNCHALKPPGPVEFSLESDVAVLDVTIEPGASYKEEDVRQMLEVALKGVQP